ncbi:N-acetylmuramoyl-L-alanine amidase [Antribacter gilvus]|uniref:peptidoglycan recognition protein family protein n=1 Tax=Antribacter gilvus TaxID=2304675 RepID=UPI000F7A56C7|nr:N-acetylmuramoyl-L-alanine amidase [Antribacter gilvus]
MLIAQANQGEAILRNRVNFHTAVTDASSLYPYFSQPDRPCSHFYVAENGVVEQYIDTRWRSSADYEGNDATISIETWDGYGRVWTSGSPPPWNAAQVRSLKALTLWILRTHRSIPPRLARDSIPGPSSFGLSWHRLGIDPWRHPQGMHYSTAYGKICPGDARVAQVPGILAHVKTDTTLTEDNQMLIIRRASDGATFIVIGGRGAGVKNTADLSAYRAAGVQTVNLSDPGYSEAQARYLTTA